MVLGVGDSGDAGGKLTRADKGEIVFLLRGDGVGVEGSSLLTRVVTVLFPLSFGRVENVG